VGAPRWHGKGLGWAGEELALALAPSMLAGEGWKSALDGLAPAPRSGLAPLKNDGG
jgi:hypothetical protein